MSTRLAPRLERTAPALLWALAAGVYTALAVVRPGAVSVELAVYYALAAVMFLQRREKERSGPTWSVLLAWSAAVLPLFSMHCPDAGPELGVVLRVVGLAWMIYSIRSLGPGFGIAPTDRGLVTRGAYRVVRHPLYAGEMMFFLGCLAGNPTWQKGVVVLIEVTADLVRIHVEEKVIRGYERYARMVRWRLLPGLF